MMKNLAMCGLNCDECKAYEATQRDDWFARRELAAQWSTPNDPIHAENINCDGCLSGSERLFTFCLDCELRRCGIGRGLTTCAACGDFPCEKVEKAPAEVRTRLDLMRN